MTKKNLKINIKNSQLAKALDLNGVKDKLAKKKASTPKKKEEEKKEVAPPKPTVSEQATPEGLEQPKRKVRARSKSAFTEEESSKVQETPPAEPIVEETPVAAEILEAEAAPETIEVEEPSPQDTLPTAEEKEEEVQPKAKAPTKSVQLGPTGKHISDILPAKAKPTPQKKEANEQEATKSKFQQEGDDSQSKKAKGTKFKDFKEVKATRKHQNPRFDSRAKHGALQGQEDGQFYRRKRPHKKKKTQTEDTTIRPTSLKIRIPIVLKDLAAEMKLKSSELIGKLFANGVVMTLNDILEDETTIQLLGQEFGCEIAIDTSEEERIRITDQSIGEEIANVEPDSLEMRAPIVTFMGHVDHGKTSLIDAIRSSNITSGEAGAITQHIGAFKCSTKIGDITILDTPGHEAFSAMRARGANVTDIVVLVVAGDEGIRQQTIEAIQHAQAAGVTIIVAINKCDKPGFNAENVYRQLADNELLPEAWGGQIITVNCSAVTKEGVNTLLEMLALQAEVLELKANPKTRARGTVLEAHMHKGLGATATVLVQNGTLNINDSLVFNEQWCHVKTMHDDNGKNVTQAGPATPVRITGLSGIPTSGEEFIAVENDKEAKSIAEARSQGLRQKSLQQWKKRSVESIFEKASDKEGKKILKVVVRGDVQGSVEALKNALVGIESDKIEIDVIFTGVGEVTESDIQLAFASDAIIIAFHTQVESHAESTLKETGVKVLKHDIIYHAVDEVKEVMVSNLDKIAQENDKGKAEVRATFKSSHAGTIAGCYVTDGKISRNNRMRVIRGGEQIWDGPIKSIRRVKDDVKDVSKGFECGILLEGFSDFLEGDVLEAYEVTYIIQQL